MKLEAQQIEHIAALARLDLSDEEKELFRQQLSSIIEYVDKLGQAEAADVEPLCHVAALGNVLRPDEVAECDDETRRRLLEAFPDREGDLLKVKAVFS
jgi:aspartyl-tRNA(Asn)/glutamyl-tRNA(Gln) amidotransferase subunit C